MFSRLGYQTLRSTEGNTEALGKTIENITNINSVGYKKSQMSFVETLSGEIEKRDSKDFAQGHLRRTGEVFDLALDGAGFFEVEMQSGQRAYTRAGRFKVSNEGELVTDEGYKVVPLVEQINKPVIEALKNGKDSLGLNIQVTTPKLIIPTDSVPEITEDGTVNVINSATGEKRKVGRINVVIVNNLQGLESLGRGYYLPTKLSGQVKETEYGPNSATRVKQGFLEYSNVDIASEMVEMAQLKNIISAQFKVLKVIDKLYEQVNYTIGKSA